MESAGGLIVILNIDRLKLVTLFVLPFTWMAAGATVTNDPYRLTGAAVTVMVGSVEVTGASLTRAVMVRGEPGSTPVKVVV